MKKLIIALAICFALTSVTWAQSVPALDQGTKELKLYGSYDGNHPLDYSLVLAGGFGYFVMDNLELTGVLGWQSNDLSDALELGRFLADNPDAFITLSGFTDSIGSQEDNLALSMVRAASVGLYLEEKFAISGDRIVLFGYGEAGPLAYNTTEEGRSRNRRVERIVAGM